MHKGLRNDGFTLIELSIVLVISGLIVGGVLAGQDLIRASAVRAQITQIEKFNTAANTFRGKYGYLPGDIKDPDATNFGFAARGQYAGEGDGNGIIQGSQADAPGENLGISGATGETAMFWVDLTVAHMVDGAFNTASSHVVPETDITGTAVDSYLPAAKLGEGNYIYVWSGSICCWSSSGVNYFGVSGVTNIPAASYYGVTYSNTSVTVRQVFEIDKKIDDGFPLTGNVIAEYLNGWFYWAGSGAGSGQFMDPSTVPVLPVAGSATTCFDNAGMGGARQQYSLAQNDGAGVNCALSFRFQ